MHNDSTLLKAQSPAALAEEYIVKSIWNNYFPPGSDLPAERELADKIGVTRTTLREVLQRLARDGWLSIQHGKPTKVNDIWETSGLNILETMIQLDGTRLPSLIANMRSARTDISMIYIPKAFKRAKEQSLSILQPLNNLQDTAEDYTKFDYDVFRNLAFASDNPVYGLILNSFKSLYSRIGLNAFTLNFKIFANARLLMKWPLACFNTEKKAASCGPICRRFYRKILVNNTKLKIIQKNDRTLC